MEEELLFCIEHAEEQMKNAVTHLERDYTKLSTGKATPQLFDSVFVDYYGQKTALAKVANINVYDARTIYIQPWEKNMLPIIEKDVLNANLGFTPQNNGEVVIINIPPLTEERRRDIAKQAKSSLEHCKVSIRNVRRDANDTIKQLQKDGLAEDAAKGGETNVQEITDKYSKQVEGIYDVKEKEIMTV